MKQRLIRRTLFAIAALMMAPNPIPPAQAHGSGAPHNYGHSLLGQLTLGVGRSGTPFAYRRDGKPVGFEIDLARAVAAEMEVELTVRWLPRDKLMPALEAGEVDLINIGALSGPPSADLDSVPYLITGEHVLVRRDNPFAIARAEDLGGTMVVATMHTAGEAFAHALAARIEGTGRAPMEVHTAPLSQYTALPVRFSHASAYFASTAAAAMQTSAPGAMIKVVPGLFQPGKPLGFGFLAADYELKRDLRLALAQVVTKGVYGDLLAAYAIPADVSPFK